MASTVGFHPSSKSSTLLPHTNRYTQAHITNKINELNKIMNFTKINNNISATSAIKAGNYIIGSITNGNVSVAHNPIVHYTTDSARTECARLARITPGVMYFFTKLNGAEMVPVSTISI